jgi:hypothetical protein
MLLDFPHSSEFYSYIVRKEREYGEKFDPSDLVAARQFAPYYGNGIRIKVEVSGEKLTGTVGVTTGWKPVFLLMEKKVDSGSSIVLDSKVKLLAVGRVVFVPV